MTAPCINDYVKTYFTLYERFEQEQYQSLNRGHPFDCTMQTMILFFIIMLVRHIFAFKAQKRWLIQDDDMVK